MGGGFRIDEFLTVCVSSVISRIHPHAATVMEAGGRELVAAKIRELGVPDRPVTIVDAARHVGFLGPDPNVIVVNPKKRRARRVQQ